MTAVAAAGAVASAGAGLYEGQQAAAGYADTQQKQQQANNDWVAYQKRIHDQEAAADDAARQKATTAQQDTLGKIGPDAQAATQTAEQERLNTLYNKNDPGSVHDMSDPTNLLLTGESTGNQNFKDSLTTAISQATSQARNRINALATAGSYGGSFGGLATTTPITLARGGNDINFQNDIRQGDLKTYGVQQQVQPLNYVVGPGTTAAASTAKGAMSLAGTLAGFAGPRAIGSFTGGVGDTSSLGGSGYNWGDFNSVADDSSFGY